MNRSLVIAVLLLGSIASMAQLPRLHLEGKHVYDHHDSLVMLRGFNWGWWGEAVPEDADIIKNDLGANTVRLAFRWHYWGGSGPDNPMNARDSLSPGNIKPDYLTLLDSYVEWLTREEIWTILFINSDQGAGKNEDHFFNTPYLKEEFLETWMFLAERYRDTPFIGAFELMAEPQYQRHGRDVGPGDIAGLYREVADSINTITDGQVPFVIGPQNYYLPDSLTDAYHLEGYQVIYAANMFKPHSFCNGTADYGYPSGQVNPQLIEHYYDVPLQFREKYDVPVWVDQWGASRLSEGYVEYTRDVVDFLERKQLHWTYWNWRQYSGNRGIFERYPKWSGDYQLDTLLFELFDSVLLGDECLSSSHAFSDTACGSYTSPGGKEWTEAGTYLDTILNAAGCDSIIRIELVFSCPSTVSKQASLAFSLHPDPSRDLVRIELEGSHEDLVLEVFDTWGRLLFRKKYQGMRDLVYQADKSPGLRIFRLTVAGGSPTVFKMIL